MNPGAGATNRDRARAIWSSFEPTVAGRRRLESHWRMSSDLTPDSDRSSSDLARYARLAGASFAVWAVFWLLQNAAMAADITRRGRELDFAQQLLTTAPLYAPWAIFCLIAWMVLEAAGENLPRPAFGLGVFVGGVFLFFAPYSLYSVALDLWLAGAPWSTFPERLQRWAALTVFVDFIMYSACITTLYALAIFRRSLDDRRRKQAVEAENLALRLEVEQHRLAALQAQLEPHFMFNALNAISALVRGEDRGAALDAIVRLSDLLRYALTASKADWTTVESEIDFIRDYLDLQAVRHGSRLSVEISTDGDGVGSAEIPPLLLQPLVENAIRHGLDGTDAACDLNILVRADEERISIAIDNPCIAGAPPNPGTGFGLAAVRERLVLIYGEAASLDVASRDGRFVVTLDLPRDPLD
jgi:two-component system sensor histidine kinase AlgZ